MIGPLVAGGLLAVAGLALVWAASRRRTVRVAVLAVARRSGQGAVRVRVRYDLVAGARSGDRRDLRDILGRLARAAGEQRAKELDALLIEAREDWDIAVLGFEIEEA